MCIILLVKREDWGIRMSRSCSPSQVAILECYIHQSGQEKRITFHHLIIKWLQWYGISDWKKIIVYWETKASSFLFCFAWYLQISSSWAYIVGTMSSYFIDIPDECWYIYSLNVPSSGGEVPSHNLFKFCSHNLTSNWNWRTFINSHERIARGLASDSGLRITLLIFS